MELNSVENAVVQNTVDEASKVQLRELNDLQLAWVGGGIGETAV